MLLSLAYTLARFLADLCLVRIRSDVQLRAEVLALRHQLRVLNGSLGRHAGSQVIASSSPPSATSCPDPPGQPCSPALRPCSDGIATSSDANGPLIAGAHLGAVARLTWTSGA